MVNGIYDPTDALASANKPLRPDKDATTTGAVYNALHVQSDPRPDISIKTRPPDNVVLLLFCAFTVPLPLWTILVGGIRALVYTLPLAAIALAGLLYAIHLTTRRLRILDGQILLQSRIATRRLLASECELIRSCLHRRRSGDLIRFRLSSDRQSLWFDVDEEQERRCRVVLSRACRHAGVFDGTIGVMRRWPTTAVLERIHTTAVGRQRWQAVRLALALFAMTGLFLAGSHSGQDVLYAAAAITAPVVVWSGLELLRERALLRVLRLPKRR